MNPTTPCHTPDELHRFVAEFLNLRIPRRAVCAQHSAPFDYLCSAYFEPARDLVVWAPRGGGKTTLGAVATLLDLLHKPGCQVRILGGSLDQSLKMWEHLQPMLESVAGDRVIGKPAARRVRLHNGSVAAVLTQSQRAVRGVRVQKMRCDEVEMFDPAIWQAAQLTTRSHCQGPGAAAADNRLQSGEFVSGADAASGDGTVVAGAIEALSTLHVPYGMMSRIVDTARLAGTRILQWCVLDVLERCPAERDCGTCALFPECQGRAKTEADGFLRIDDAIRMKQRVARETWDAEMLCLRPSLRRAVFPHFSEQTHVREQHPAGEGISLGIDFGFAAPLVCLWICSDGAGNTHVFDEYVQAGRQLHEHLEQIESRKWGRAGVIACDPAGEARSDQTARSNVQLLRAAGYRVLTKRRRIVDGIEDIRAALAPAAGDARLFIHPRCVRLIEAFRCYHYPEEDCELPIKDGRHDHLIDALRYHFNNVSAGAGVRVFAY